MANGVPFDVAFEMSDTYRAAFAIILSEHASGMQFNFRTGKFQEQKS